MKYRCSKCQGIFEGTPNYCPHCGTKLKWANQNTVPEVKVAPVEQKAPETKVEPPVSDNKVSDKDYLKSFNVINFVCALIGLTFFVILFFAHLFTTKMNVDGNVYDIGFGYLDFLVYILAALFKGSLDFLYIPWLGLIGTIIALVGLIVFIVHTIKSLIALSKHKSFSDQKIYGIKFKKDPAHFGYTSLIFILLFVIFNKVNIGGYIGTYFFQKINILPLVFLLILAVAYAVLFFIKKSLYKKETMKK